jgi:predicted outer membrane protein
MKFPALSILAHRMILTAVLLAMAGCGWPKRQRTHFGTPPPPATPVPGSTPPPFAAEDKKFFNTAYRVFVYERKLGSLGKQYANSDDARNLAGLMETEMGLAIQDLKTLVDSKKQTMDASEGWGHSGLERLANQKGGDFDRKFYEEVKLSSSDAYIAFDQAFRVTVDAGVKEFAKNWYPILRNYPREAIRLETLLNKKHK